MIVVTQSVVGERIKERREAAGLSIYRLSKKANVSSGYLSDLENAVKNRPSADVLARIAAALGTTVDYLVGKSDDPTPPPVADADVLRADMPIPPEGWDELTEEEKEDVRRITRRFEETIIADILRTKKSRGTRR